MLLSFYEIVNNTNNTNNINNTNNTNKKNIFFIFYIQSWPKILSTYIFFIYLEFFYLYCFLLVIGIIHKFKELKQRIMYSKCHKSIFELER